MLAIVLAVVVFLMAIALCLHNHSLSSRRVTDDDDAREFIARAAEQSIAATNCVNPLLALVHVTRALETMENAKMLFDKNQLDTLCAGRSFWTLLTLLREQKERIMQDVARRLDPAKDARNV